MRNLEKVKNIIVKIGSSSLCDQNGNIDKEKILNLIQQIAYIKRKNIKITLVSSGAINAGVHIMNLKQRPDTIPQKQALAAIGQASLMQIYEDLFSLFKLKCAQILLNHDDFDDRKRLMNFNNAMQAIIDYDVVPIINENDTLAVDEIKVGDNDTLASMIVPAVNADLVIIVSDIDGLYDDNPHTNKNVSFTRKVFCKLLLVLIIILSDKPFLNETDLFTDITLIQEILSFFYLCPNQNGSQLF